MSSRALRRAQKELEEQQRLAQLGKEDEADESDESDEHDLPNKPKASLFAMLADAEGSEDQEGEDADDADTDIHGAFQQSLETAETVPATQGTISASSNSQKKKKKKKKKKSKAKPSSGEPNDPASSKEMPDMDEIDRALLALNIKTRAGHNDETSQLRPAASEELQHLYSVLAVDSQRLQPANEMRKLFGRIALETDNNEPARARQHGRGPHGIAGALAGYNAGDRSLASLGRRRNIFVQAKDEWPQATSGGLSMEIVEKRSDGTVEYRFVHNRNYQDVQGQFEICVSSMDPDRMVQMLQLNPYHISTLLQVSEIAKQERENTTASDLLERALFAFGRAVHSTFPNTLSQGKARLDFRRPENREFWLAVWRYITTLGVRALWRTAFEWARLLVSLAPEDDPYCIRLLIDQLALRGREPQTLIDMVESDHLQRSWKIPPNLAFSVALAYDRLQQPEKARTSLRLAMREYPWIASRLCKELEISPIPSSIWGKQPHDQQQELLCQLYASKATDLWNTPEATSLLVEIAHSIDEPLGDGEDPYWLAPINESNLARHVILSDDRSLLSLLDQRIKSKYTSVSDPLPPDENIPSYDPSSGGSQQAREGNERQLVAELEELRAYFTFITSAGIGLEQGLGPEEIVRVLEQAGTSLGDFRRNARRLEEVRSALQRLGIRVIFEDEREGEQEDQENLDDGHDSSSDSDV